jgi:hypothetical protein|tara:strand:- start:1565 stop:1813 length:249 start_codon:yes stop_codon:yes gene_type:complete
MVLKKSQKSLKNWTEQEWDYISAADRRKPKSERGRYLPKSVRKSLTPSQKAAENKKKKTATKAGKQKAKYGKAVKSKMKGMY